jgi:pimeloyl-ACP methyl ester carboxylesterase
MTQRKGALRPPGPHLVALECRAPAEAAASLLLWPWLRRAPRGDGHSVLVLPGLAAPDASTALLRRFLRHQGWQAHGWRQGFNLGLRRGVIEGCIERVRVLQRESGRKVSLVGWSLGGVYARELCKLLPGAVRQVITLGSPVGRVRMRRTPTACTSSSAAIAPMRPS